MYCCQARVGKLECSCCGQRAAEDDLIDNMARTGRDAGETDHWLAARGVSRNQGVLRRLRQAVISCLTRTLFWCGPARLASVASQEENGRTPLAHGDERVDGGGEEAPGQGQARGLRLGDCG